MKAVFIAKNLTSISDGPVLALLDNGGVETKDADMSRAVEHAYEAAKLIDITELIYTDYHGAGNGEHGQYTGDALRAFLDAESMHVLAPFLSSHFATRIDLSGIGVTALQQRRHVRICIALSPG